MVRVLSFAMGLCLAASATASVQSVVQGIGQAKDGDSLLVGKTEIRLFGIDAPEWGQMCSRNGESWDCGAVAADALSKLVTGKLVMCWSVGTDDFQRTLARCSVKGIDINQTLVREGFAVAFRRYSDDYEAAELEAKASKLGLWSGEFQRPDEFRSSSTSRVSAETLSKKRGSVRPISNDWAARAKSYCNIKGNRNRRGQWIYHVPGMPFYDQTRPEEIFCTELEAQAAGYRRAIVK